LALQGCLLIYRRRGQDMPLAQPPENATLDQIAKTEAIRQKMLHLAQEKYLFRFQDRKVSTGLLIEDGRLVGLKLAETKVEGRKAEPLAGSEYEVRAPMVISSIGSLPEEIPGVGMNGEYYDFNNESVPEDMRSEKAIMTSRREFLSYAVGIALVTTSTWPVRADQARSMHGQFDSSTSNSGRTTQKMSLSWDVFLAPSIPAITSDLPPGEKERPWPPRSDR
jgi:hypothetical protein